MKEKEAIILIGGGGHCKSCIDVIEQENKYKIAGIIDLPDLVGTKVLDYEVIASDEDLSEIEKAYNNFHITLGHLGAPMRRVEIYNILKKLKVELPIIVSPFAYCSKHVKKGEGSIILHSALINAGVEIGRNSIINTKALIEHDTTIGNDTHISTGAVVNGSCSIGNNCFIGSNSTIKNSVIIPDDTIIGAGSVVVKNIQESGIYAGVPATRIK